MRAAYGKGSFCGLKNIVILQFGLGVQDHEWPDFASWFIALPDA